MLTNKTTAGQANSYYYDPQLVQGRLYLWGTASYGNSAVVLTVQRPLQDMSSATDDFDFPVEALNAIKAGLADELAPEYDISPAKAQMIAMKAMKLKESLFDFSQEDTSVTFSPNLYR